MLGAQQSSLSAWVLMVSAIVSISIGLSSSHKGNIFSRVFSLGEEYAVSANSEVPARTRARPYVTAAELNLASQSRDGWGWGKGGGDKGHEHDDDDDDNSDYVHSHTTYENKGLDFTSLLGGLGLLGLLGLALFAFSKPAPLTIIIGNTSGRRRRAVDDFDDGLMEGETLPQFLNRIGKYFDKSWSGSGKTGNSKVEPFKLY